MYKRYMQGEREWEIKYNSNYFGNYNCEYMDKIVTEKYIPLLLKEIQFFNCVDSN